MQRPWSLNIRWWRGAWLSLFFLASVALAAEPHIDPKLPAPPSRQAVERLASKLQGQATRLAEMVGAHLGDETLGPRDVKAIIEVLALQRVVEVFANLVETYNRKDHQDILGRSLLWVEEFFRRAEVAFAEAPKLRSMEAAKPPSAAHPVSIRSTLSELRNELGLTQQPAFSRLKPVGPPPSLGYLGPDPTDNEFQVVQFNLELLRAAFERMKRGKCYRDFWTRHCADALESHALAHQRRSFIRLMVATRDLLRKYCSNPRLAALRGEYGEFLRQLSIRPIVFDYGAGTTPFVDRPEFFRLQCTQPG